MSEEFYDTLSDELKEAFINLNNAFKEIDAESLFYIYSPEDDSDDDSDDEISDGEY